MTFRNVLGALGALVLAVVIVGAGIYGYNRLFSEPTRDDVAATIREELRKAGIGQKQTPTDTKSVIAETIRDELKKAGIDQQKKGPPANPETPTKVQAFEVEIIPLNAKKTNVVEHTLHGQQCAGQEGKKIRVRVTAPDGKQGWSYYSCPLKQ